MSLRHSVMIVVAFALSGNTTFGSLWFDLGDEVYGGVRLTYVADSVDLTHYDSVDVAFEALNLNGGFLTLEAQHLFPGGFGHATNGGRTTATDGAQVISLPLASHATDLLVAINLGSSSINPAKQSSNLSGTVSEIRLMTVGGRSRLVDDFSGPQVSESRSEVDPVGPQGTLGSRTGENDLRQIEIAPAHVLGGERRTLAFVRQNLSLGDAAISYEIDGDGTGTIVPIPEPIRAISQAETIRSFSNSEGNGIVGMTIVDSTVHGLTFNRVFSLQQDGSDFQSSQYDGQTPYHREPAGSLSIADDKIFAAADIGGFFSVHTDGAAYQTLATREDAGIGFKNPIVVGSRLFGQTHRGVFSMNLDGTDIQYTQGDIASPPSAQLSFDGDRIYGATWPRFRFDPSAPLVQDGALVFSMKPDGTDYRTLLGNLDFAITTLDVSGETIYGVERAGRIFSLNKDGSNFEELPIEGNYIIVEGDRLFGLADGGTENQGTLFRSNLDGSDFEVIHEFGFGPNNGFYPNHDLVVIGSTLYGSTRHGGEEWKEWREGGGMLYSVPTDASSISAVPEPVSIVIWLGLGLLFWWNIALPARHR